MKCPFELPARKYQNKNSRFCEIHSLSGHIANLVTIEDADYIVHIINSYEKHKTALENIVELETDCCQRCEGNGRLYADGKGHLMSENAETILCGNCGGSGRILPEDAQTIASEALMENNK